MMFSTAVVLSVSLNAIFAEALCPNMIRGSPRFVPQKEAPPAQGDQFYPPSMQQLPMEGNQQMYPMPQQPMPQQPMMQQPMMLQPMMQQPMMQTPMMQGIQSPFLPNNMSPQQLSLLFMATYARMMGLSQLMNMQNNYQPYQPYQPNQFSDPAVSNYGKTQVPLPYAQEPQEPQAEPQNNLENEMLQRQKQQAESQHRAILDDRRIKRDYDIEVQRREDIIKRRAEEEELEKQQKEIERQLFNEQEIERERKEAEKQILEEQQKEREQKEKDLKLREEEERRLKKKEEDQSRQNQDMKLKMKISLRPNRPRKIKQK